MSTATATAKSVVEAYVTGTRTRDVDLLKTIFHEGAVMSGWLGPDLLTGGPDPFYGALAANEIADDYRAEITAFEEDGPIATATLKEDNLLGLSFTNQFHLTRQSDDTWRIISKLFRHS